MSVQPARRDIVTVFEDSRRWRSIDLRPDDIIVSTPPKCGTTWTQGILASLLWPDGDLPAALGEISPWIDMRVRSIEEVVDQIEAQEHRRFLKTHSPADALPRADDVSYIVVYRDGRDALASWSNHRAGMRPEIIEWMNALAAEDGIAPLPPTWSGDMDDLLDEWEHLSSPVHHLRSWWPRRSDPNVLFVHYNDLTADLEGEMRRIADFLGVGVPDSLWDAVVERCAIDHMRDRAAASGALDLGFDRGAERFFFKGTNGRWVDLLTDAQVERCVALTATLPADAAEWLEHGSLALGRRP